MMDITGHVKPAIQMIIFNYSKMLVQKLTTTYNMTRMEKLVSYIFSYSTSSTELKSNWKFFCINLLPCPGGFAFNEVTQMCQCDPVLTVVSSCNIDDQTVVRPANSWVVGSKISMLTNYPCSVHLTIAYLIHRT